MPSISERLRRPMDESMLLRLVMVTGLVRGTELAKFYADGGGGLDGSRSLEDFLLANGVDPEDLSILKRAYVETTNFGTTLLENLKLAHVEEARIRATRQALNACETQQLLAIRRGEAPRPIGEMLVERGLISRADLEKVIRQQGMLAKIERYTSERSTAGGSDRLGIKRLRSRLLGMGAAIGAAGMLVVVILVNLWLAGVFEGAPDRFASAGGPEGHVRNVQAHYANMFAELRRGQVGNAEHYRAMLGEYFQRLDRAGVVLKAEEVVRIRTTYSGLDFGRLDEIPSRDRLRLSQTELEKRLARKP